MRLSSRVSRLLAVVIVVVGVLALSASSSFAQRLRSPSSTLNLATPTVLCGATPQIVLAWSDSAHAIGTSYYVMSKTSTAKQNSWSSTFAGTDVLTTQVPVSNNTSWDFAIRAVNSVTRDSAVTSVPVSCAPVDGTAPPVPTITSAVAASCSQVNLAWTSVTDTGGSGLAGYNLYRGGVFIHRVNAPATTYSDTGLAASTPAINRRSRRPRV